MSNRYTAVNEDGELATLPSGAVLTWTDRRSVRAATKEQPGKWSVITVNSRRYHAAVSTTFEDNKYQPTFHPMPSDEPEA